MCWAFTSSTSNWPSKRFHTGFQYTPVDSRATWVTPQRRSQSASSNRSRVNVANSRVCRRRPLAIPRTPSRFSCVRPNHNRLHAKLASQNSFRRLAEDVSKLPKFLNVLPALRQRQQFVVPIDIQVIFVLGLKSRQNSSAFVHSAVLQTTSISSTFSWFVVVRRTMIYS